ncbi:MAG: hypothetical protein JXB85_07875 [Anaerolineales bacterium]|nr:hypothetical protein [Anaerolineales bacterium]
MPTKKNSSEESVNEIVPPAGETSAPIIPAETPGYQPDEKPGLVTTLVVLTLINGILNILWGLGASLGVTAGIVTICLVPLTILPTVLGIFEVVYASKLLSNPPQPVQPSQTIAVLEICCILVGNVVSLVVGILALVFYSDPVVKAYFAKINTHS